MVTTRVGGRRKSRGEKKVPDSPRPYHHKPGSRFWLPTRERSRRGIPGVESRWRQDGSRGRKMDSLPHRRRTDSAATGETTSSLPRPPKNAKNCLTTPTRQEEEGRSREGPHESGWEGLGCNSAINPTSGAAEPRVGRELRPGASP